jgi:hypothetical protein
MFILQTEKKFVHEIETQRYVNSALVEIMEKLHTNEINWKSIVDAEIDPKPLTQQLFPNDFPYEIHYQIKQKDKKNGQGKLTKEKSNGICYHMVTIELKVTSIREPKILSYSYDLFIERQTKEAELPNKSHQNLQIRSKEKV